MIAATLTKRYAGKTVLRGATIAIARGSVHALVGENGAGKSTLVKLVAGIERADGGTLEIDGAPVALARWDRVRARAAAIGIVQQHGASAGTLSVVENAVLGVEGGFLLELESTATALARLGKDIGMPIDPWARADELGPGAAQRAEIVAALHHGAKLLILDEPTAVLAPVEVDGLLATLRALAERGTTIVLVTHKLDEVRAVADAVTVLRAGETVATFAAPLEVGAIAHAIIGSDPVSRGELAAVSPDASFALEVRGLASGIVQGVDLRVARGELVGVAGIDGNGQRELALAIAGLAPARGVVRIGERDVSADDPATRLAHGLAHVPEDRHHGGLLLDASIADNLALARTDVTGRFRIDRDAVAAHAKARIRELDIRPDDPGAIVRALSGGNQQKVVIGRELSRPALTAIIAAQPTRGVDLGAVANIHARLRAAAERGAGVLVISADLDELIALCHRIVVVLRGRIVGERARTSSGSLRDELGALMTGVA